MIPKGFLTPGVISYQFFIRIQLFILDRESCLFLSSSLFGHKSVFTLNCKFLKTFIHTEETKELITNIYLVFHYAKWYCMIFQMFSIL